MDVRKLEAMAAAAFRQHGLSDWTFHLVNAKRRLGACKYGQKRIEISEYHARHNEESSVLDTLFHEIAHALAGPRAKHGPKWKLIAMRLGATPHACESSDQLAVTPGDWQAKCPACQRVFHKYRQPARLSGYHCRCPARADLTFAYVGDPQRAPVRRPVAGYLAVCPGCGHRHRRLRRPKAGLWRCRCPARCELRWQHVAAIE